MSVTFDRSTWPDVSDKKRFGLCDEPPPSKEPAYLDEENGADWIAVVHNDDRFTVYFAGVDNQIELLRPDGKMDSRCDGVMSYNDTIAFVELKQRAALGNAWVEDGEGQLRSTIAHFERTEEAEKYTVKRAYIANSERPIFKESQQRRMNQFAIDTGYVLRVEGRLFL